MGAQVSGCGQVAIAASAVGYGVGTALSVVALHGLRPADLLAIELAGSAAVLLAFAAALGALLAFNIGIGTVSASRAGLLYTLQPLAGALTAVALLGEPVVAGQAFGAALILACLVVLTRAEPTDHPTPDADADAVQTTR